MSAGFFSASNVSRVAAVVAGLAAGVATFSGLTTLVWEKSSGVPQLELYSREVEEVLRQQQMISKLVDTLQQSSQASQTPLPEGQLTAAILELQKQTADITKRIALFEKAVSDSPEKALSLPLIRKDMDQITTQMVAAKIETQQQVDRLYDLFKWFIPAFGAVALSLLGLAFKRGG